MSYQVFNKTEKYINDPQNMWFLIGVCIILIAFITVLLISCCLIYEDEENDFNEPERSIEINIKNK